MKIKQMELTFKDGSSIYLSEDKARELYLKLKGLFGGYDELTKSYNDYCKKYEPQWVTTFSDNPQYADPYVINYGN